LLELAEEDYDLPTLQLATNNSLTSRIHTVDLKHRLRNIKADRRDDSIHSGSSES
jgi:hypothetical protein